jgi:thymidylate kinase
MAEMSARLAIWALEGLPFAGKSSSGRFLKECWPQTLLLRDYHDLLPAKQRGAVAEAPDSPAEQRGRIEMYLELDRSRWRRVLDAKRGPVVLDRCHLSLMAYAIALEPWIGASASNESIDRVERALRDPDHPLREPAVLVYLEMGAETASERCRTHATTMQESLRTVRFAQRLIDAYEQVLASAPSEVVRCSSEQPLDELQVEVAAKLRARKP